MIKGLRGRDRGRPAPGGRRPGAIVLTIDPGIFPGMTAHAMRGWAARTGQVRSVPYGPLPWPVPLPMFAKATARNLDKALRRALADTDGIVWVLGWSLGAQVIYKWLRDYGLKSNFPVERVRFVSLGNPERAHGGACVVPTPPTKISGRPKAAYGGCGVPAGNLYTVWDFVRGLDGWADCPTVEQPAAEALAAPNDAIHMDYFSASIEDEDVLTFAGADRVIYLFKPTRMADAAKQSRIERSYQRPAYTKRRA